MELHIIKYCAEECARQGSGEESVYDMCNAWQWAQAQFEFCVACAARADTPHDVERIKINLGFIEQLGKIVEPDDNKNGFRTIPIGVSNGFEWIEKSPWERVPYLLETLLDGYYEGEPIPEMMNPLAKTAEDQFYFDYENIHPFRDGNGRSGKILYNYLNGTLDNPIMPPNFWNASNP